MALRDSGVEAAVAIPDGAASDILRTRGIPVLRIVPFRLHRPGLNPFRVASDAIAFLRARRATARAIRGFEPDIIHANGLQAALASIPLVPDRGKNGAPLLMHVRDIRFPPRAMRFAARRVSCIVAISRAVEDRLREILPRRLHGKVRRIQNAIDERAFAMRRIDRAEARRRLALPSGAVVIGMMSHFAPWKRHDRFVDMAREILAGGVGDAAFPGRDRIHFAIAGADIAGDNPGVSRALRGAASDPALAGRLHLLGDADGACFLSAIDLLVHPATGEPFGRVIAEAKAFGLPIVAVDSAGPAEQLAGYARGWLVPDAADVPRALAAAAVSVLISGSTGGDLHVELARCR